MKFDIGGLISKLKPGKKTGDELIDDDFGIDDDIDGDDGVSEGGGETGSVEDTGEAAAEGDAPGEGGGGEDIDDDDIEFDDPFEEEDEGGDAAKKKKLMIFGGAGAAAVVLLAAGGWFFFSGGDEEAEMQASQRVALALPKKGQQSAAEGVEPVKLNQSMGLKPQQQTTSPKPQDAQGETSKKTAPTASLNAATKLRPGAIGGAGVVVPMSTLASYSKITRSPPGEPLPAAPLPEMIEPTGMGPLPKIATDGRQPWNVYARPMPAAANQPRISIIVKGLGLSKAATQAAIDSLPPEVTLAFDAYGEDLDQWLPKARAKGHEVLITLPLEPEDYPASDPGPAALLTSLSPEINAVRLSRILGKGAGYVGLLTAMGSQFTASEHHLRPILIALKNRGVMIVDARTTPETKVASIAAEIELPRAFVNMRLDAEPSPALIDAKFQELITSANKLAVAVAIAEPLPVSLDRISAWVDVLKKQKITLAPVSSIANRQISQ